MRVSTPYEKKLLSGLWRNDPSSKTNGGLAIQKYRVRELPLIYESQQKSVCVKFIALYFDFSSVKHDICAQAALVGQSFCCRASGRLSPYRLLFTA